MHRLPVAGAEEQAIGVPCVVDGCDGIAIPTKKDGRFYPYKKNPNVLINLPPDFVIPRCSDCGTELFNEDLHKALIAVMEIEYAKHASMVDSIIKRSTAVQ